MQAPLKSHSEIGNTHSILDAPCAAEQAAEHHRVENWTTPRERMSDNGQDPQENLCLSMGFVNSPLSSCLVGVPFKPSNLSPPHPFAGKWPAPPTTEKGPAQETWEKWVKIIPKSASDSHEERPSTEMEPHELDLLGSTKDSY